VASKCLPRWTLLIEALCFGQRFIHWDALAPRVSEGTFFSRSCLSETLASANPSNITYGFARPPVYAALGWVVANPLAFLTFGFVLMACSMSWSSVWCWRHRQLTVDLSGNVRLSPSCSQWRYSGFLMRISPSDGDALMT